MRRKVGIARDVEILSSLEVTGIRRRLVLVAALSMVGGLSQALALSVLAASGVRIIQGKRHLTLHGVSISTLEVCLGAGVLVLVFAAAMLTANFLGSRLAGRTLYQTRSAVISSFFNGSWSLQSAEHVGHVQQILAYDCEVVGMLINNISSMLSIAFMVLALLLVAAIINPLVTGSILVVSLLLSLILRPVQRRLRGTGRELKATNQIIGRRVTEYTRLAREFRIFGVEEASQEQLSAQNRRGAAVFARSKRMILSATVVYAAIGLMFAVFGFAFIAGLDHQNLGASASVLIIILRVMLLASNLQGVTSQVSTQSVVLEELVADVQRFRSTDRRSKENLVPRDFGIEVEGLNFSYGSEAVLHDLTFSVPDGAKVGILGRSGSGKTTLSQILLGVLEPGSGRVELGGCPPADVHKSGGSPLALVTQDALLLEGTISANIDFFRGFDEATIAAAATAANLDDDLERMADGIETLIGPSGDTLSGGQRQRVALARALVGNPRMLLLDEPTSSVDVQSEQAIGRSIDALTATTTIIVSHRVAVLDGCDLLMVMESGRILDFGPRAEVEAGKPYRLLLASTEEEMAPHAG